MAKLKVKKGLEANLPAVEDGSLLITTDSKKLYLDNGEERIQVGGDSGGSAGTYLFHMKFTDGSETAVTNIDGDDNKLQNAVQNGLCVIARLHDYENMSESQDFYLFNEYGGSEGVSSPFRFFRVSDKGELQIIGITGLTAAITYTTRNLSATILTFTKSTTSDSEYSCSVSVTDISNTSGTVLGKVRNDSNVSDTYFYRVYNVPASETADGETVTFISCDGDVIKKLTSQYSDSRVWHYSEQSLSGGANSSIYTSEGIKTPNVLAAPTGAGGFPIMNSDGSITYSLFNQGKTTLSTKPATVDNTTTDVASVTAKLGTAGNSQLDFLVQSNDDSSGLDTGISLRRDGETEVYLEPKQGNLYPNYHLGNYSTPWQNLNVNRVKGQGNSVTSNNDEVKTFTISSLLNKSTSSNYTYSNIALTSYMALGPAVGSEGTGDYVTSLVHGYTDSIHTALYSSVQDAQKGNLNTITQLGTNKDPWGKAFFLSSNLGSNSASTYGDVNVSFVGPDFSNSTNSTDYAQTRILQRFGTSPSAPTNSHTTNSRIQIGAQSQYVYPGGTSTESKSFTGMLDIETYIAGSYIGGLIVSPVAVTDISTSAYNMYLGSSQRPWTSITFGLPDSQENLQGSSIVITRNGGNYSSSSSSSSAITQTSTLTIQQAAATSPTAAMTGGWHQQSQIKLQCDSRFKYNTNSNSYSASLLINNYPSPVNVASRFEVYPDLPANEPYKSFLGTSDKPWTFTYTKNIYIGDDRVTDYVVDSYNSGSTRWVKWASGRFEQWMFIWKGTINSSDWSSWGSSGLYTYNITNTSWPVAFSTSHNGSTTDITPITTISASASDSILWSMASNVTATALPKISLVGPGNITRYNVRIDIHGEGYWK